MASRHERNLIFLTDAAREDFFGDQYCKNKTCIDFVVITLDRN